MYTNGKIKKTNWLFCKYLFVVGFVGSFLFVFLGCLSVFLFFCRLISIIDSFLGVFLTPFGLEISTVQFSLLFLFFFGWCKYYLTLIQLVSTHQTWKTRQTRKGNTNSSKKWKETLLQKKKTLPQKTAWCLTWWSFWCSAVLFVWAITAIVCPITNPYLINTHSITTGHLEWFTWTPLFIWIVHTVKRTITLIRLSYATAVVAPKFIGWARCGSSYNRSRGNCLCICGCGW